MHQKCDSSILDNSHHELLVLRGLHKNGSLVCILQPANQEPSFCEVYGADQ